MCVFFRGDERLDMSKDCLHSMSKWTMITFVCLIVKGRSKIWREEKGKPCHSGFTNRCWIEKCASAVSVFSEKENTQASNTRFVSNASTSKVSFLPNVVSREREKISKNEEKPNLYAKRKSSSSFSPLIGTHRKALIHSTSFGRFWVNMCRSKEEDKTNKSIFGLLFFTVDNVTTRCRSGTTADDARAASQLTFSRSSTMKYLACGLLFHVKFSFIVNKLVKWTNAARMWSVD